MLRAALGYFRAASGLLQDREHDPGEEEITNENQQQRRNNRCRRRLADALSSTCRGQSPATANDGNQAAKHNPFDQATDEIVRSQERPS